MPSPGEWLVRLPPLAAYGLLTGLVFVEGILVVSPFVPTLGPLLVAGALAYSGTLQLWWVVVFAAAGAVLGDALGFLTGQRLGPRLRTSRLARRSPQAWERASEALRRRGGPAMVVCRFLPLVRSAVPHLIGASGLPHSRMAPHSLLAGVMWACGEGGVGYLAGASLNRLSGGLGVVPVVALAVVVLVVVLLWRRKRRGEPVARRQPESVG